ncbi:MAG: UV DNA damage repair endonuclease UvsE [Sedimentibacter sp.]|uniref:UV DNA damage repair endonuclease UvsE n=1 Tax=Sedimentibacter sp. TaxID=1960295 RepID=UPI003158FC3B
MSIGYACLAVGVKDAGFKSCTMKNADTERLTEITEHNLRTLENIIEFNAANNIKLFRITSGLVPFGSSPVNNLPWHEMFEGRFLEIGKKIKDSGMRVSMHPGQYTVLNSPNDDVVKRAVEDLDYHCLVLDSLKAGQECKIVLHVGGVYDNRKSALERFVRNYMRLKENVKNRLVIENDDRMYSIEEVLETGIALNIPVVYDNLHNAANPCGSQSDDFWISQCNKTWKAADGKQKIHYSQQDPSRKKGSHSEFIRVKEFMNFYGQVKGENLDIMLEVKDKNLSCVKCINCTSERNINILEKEWGRYKYAVLEKSPSLYQEIRHLLKDKEKYPVVEFYELIEGAMTEEMNKGHAINAAQHVWGYFKNTATQKEKDEFSKLVSDFMRSESDLLKIKRMLFKLSFKYGESYLLDSYYFLF